jgi:hypothetical protein
MEDPALSSSTDGSDPSSQIQSNVEGDGNQVVANLSGGNAINKVDGNVFVNSTSDKIKQNITGNNDQVIATVSGGAVFGNITGNVIIGQSAMPISTEYSRKQSAIPRINSLENNTIELFLRKANDPETMLYDKLRGINYTDGRNSKGIFPKILTVEDIQVVLIDGQNQFGRYCYRIESKPKHQKCSTKITETYLILIPSKTGVHKAVIYTPFLFTVRISKETSWYMNENLKEYNHSESIEIDEPNQVFANQLVRKL